MVYNLEVKRVLYTAKDRLLKRVNVNYANTMHIEISRQLKLHISIILIYETNTTESNSGF